MARPTIWSDERAEEYRRLRYWTDDTFVGFLDQHAAQRPSAIAYSDRERSLTWLDVRRWVDGMACSLVRLGLERDAVVAAWLGNCVENYLVRLACERAGLIWLQVPISARPRELQPMLETSRAALLVLDRSGRRDHLAELEEVRPSLPDLRWVISVSRTAPSKKSLDDLAGAPARPEEVDYLSQRSVRWHEIAMLQPTSGSTGVPKLCSYVLAGAMARGRAQTALFQLSSEDRFLATVQGFGPSIPPLLAAPVVGAEVILADHAPAEDLLRLIEERQPTIVCGVPPIYRELLPLLERRAGDAGSVRIWYSTGVALPPDLAQRLEELTDTPVLSGYGGVDLGCWSAPAPEDPPAVRWFTVGRPRGGTELRLAGDENGTRANGEGEVWGRGPSSTGGYFGSSDSTAQAWASDGWFRTGDLGHFDSDGNLVISGRTIEVINRGGQKIYPLEVEQLLAEYPALAGAAVVPYPDDRLGQRSCACVVPANGAAVSLEELVAFLRGRGLASYKLPERLQVLERLPITSGGKLDRAALQASLERAAEQLQAGRAHARS